MMGGNLPPIDGEYVLDENVRRHFSADYGAMVRSLPAIVAFPNHAGDVAALLAHATSVRLPVAVRAKGHSLEGQSLVQDGLCIVTERLRLPETARINTGRRTATVGTGSTWSEVARKLSDHGLGIPVLPEYLGMTVGGTLSCAGIGKGSHAFGSQLDLVEAIELVTGDGRRFTCSPDRHADLFFGCLGGLGQLGIIVEAEIRVEALNPFVTQAYAVYDDDRIGILIADLHAACSDPNVLTTLAQNKAGIRAGSPKAAGPDSNGKRNWVLFKSVALDAPIDHRSALAVAESLFAGCGHVPGSLGLVTAPPAAPWGEAMGSVPYLDFIHQMENAPRFKERLSPDINRGERAVDTRGNATAQPWFDAFLPLQGLEKFIGDRSPSDLGWFDTLILTPVISTGRETGAALFQYPEGIRKGELFYCFTEIKAVTAGETQTQLMRNERRLLTALESGGRNYIIDGILEPSIWSKHLGGAVLAEFLKLKLKYDPGRILSGSVQLPNEDARVTLE